MTTRTLGDTDAALAAYFEAVSHNDGGAALDVAAQLLAGGRGVGEVLEHVVVPAQRRVGALWEDGSWSVAREHAATGVSEFVVRSLLRDIQERVEPHVARRRSAVVVACAEREWHALPALIVATVLADAGHRVRHLGGDVSTRRLQGELLDTPTRAVLVSASITSSFAQVRRHVETATQSGIPVVVGGRAFAGDASLAEALGATAYAGAATALVDVIADLPEVVRPARPLQHPGAAEAAQLGVRSHQLTQQLIDGVLPHLDVDDELTATLRDQMPTIVGTLVGALLVDRPEVLDHALGWLDEVTLSRGGPSVRAVVVDALGAQLREYPAAQALVGAVRAVRA